MKWSIISLLLAFSGSVSAGVVDVSHDVNTEGQVVNTLVVSHEIAPNVSVVAIADTTKYGELYLGYSSNLGALTLSTYLGAESVGKGSPKSRGMVVASYTFGAIRLGSVVEFSGVTGNFNKQTLSYVSQAGTCSLVRHSVAGAGVGVDIGTKHIVPYVQVLKRRGTIGLVYRF